MKKIVATINMTVDGFCNHTAMTADDEIHVHYNDLLANADMLLYGRITYQLMESYWPSIVNNPTGNKPTDEFAVLIDNIPKIVFSRTLKDVSWKNTELRSNIIREEVLALKQSGINSDKNILVGSPGLIKAFTQLQLVDEYQLVVHPVVLGKGLHLFENISHKINLKRTGTKKFGGGAILLCYKPAEKQLP
jgi:dihydrofolate reductase